MGRYKQFHFRLLSYNVLAMYLSRGFVWVRLFGVGILLKDTTRCRLIFSEREGTCRYLKIGRWIIRFLKYKRL